MKNHFQKFSLAVKFDLDLDLLEQKYFAFQQQFHPDKAGIAEIENSIAINEAYEILKNPLKRAAHILQLEGVDVENDEKAPKANQSTLLEIFELQEKVASLAQDEILPMKKELNLQMKMLLQELALYLENKDFANGVQLLIRAKYLDKTLRDLKKNVES